MDRERKSVEAERTVRFEEMANEAQEVVLGIRGVDELNLSLFRAAPYAGERCDQPGAWKVWIETLSKKERTFVSLATGHLGRLIRDPGKTANIGDITIGEARVWMAGDDTDWKDMGKYKKAFVVRMLTPLEK